MTKKIQGYILQQCVGKGSSGEVFRATHCSKQGQFAIKVIENQLLIDNPKAQQCLINEVNILSKIGQCQNIVAFYELIKTKNNHYFVYEFCNGGSLYDKLKKIKRFPENQAIGHIKDILSAYKILNKYKVLHRDLKPENILFHNGVLKLADFGLCKGLKPEQSMTRTMLGSPIYMAPEVLKGQSYTSKADIWSLGVILFQMLYGYCPYLSSSIASLVSKIDSNPLQFPQKVTVTATTKNILKKMLNKDHFKRIGWIQLFKEFFIEEDVVTSFKSLKDVEQKIRQKEAQKQKERQKQRELQERIRELEERQKSKQRKKGSKGRIRSKKTSLCLIENNPFANMKEKEQIIEIEQSQSAIPEKENRMQFSSAKFMNLLNKNDDRVYKRLSNFAVCGDPTGGLTNFSTPIFSKQYEKNQLTNKNFATNFISKNQASFPKGKPQTPRNQSPSSKNSLSPKTKQNLQKFTLNLQKLHQQFVKNSSYCESLIISKNKQNLRDILQFLQTIKSKLVEMSRQLSRIKKNMHPEHEDLQTMIKYQIIGVEATLENIYACLGEKYFRGFGAFGIGGMYSNFNLNANGYKFKSYTIQRACSRVMEIKL